MIVTLDGEKLDGGFSTGTTLMHVLQTVRCDFAADRLLVAVSLNGQPLVEDELEARMSDGLDGGDQVDLESADRRSVAAEALRAAAEQVEQAAGVAVVAAEGLNSGRAAEALRSVSQIVEAWQAAQRVLGQTGAVLGEAVTGLLHDGRPIDGFADELAQKLTELRDALESRDLVLVADLLHYEMPPMCDAWRELLRAVAEQIDPVPA